MSDELEYYRNLATTMWKTRQARFGASASLSFKDRFGIGTSAFLIIYMISWSVASLAFPEFFTSTRGQVLNVISIISSVSLLAITLMEFAFRRSVKAQILQQNALSISLIMRKLETELATANPNFESLRQLASDYELLNFETQINHTVQDFKRWQYSVARTGSTIENIIFFFRYQGYRIWLFCSSMFVYIALCALVIGVTVWCALGL
ncbi:SLATT domain-containing protein [Thalassospira sp. NFXS8]|uniref:SLATT domain-containing protein n=1 Tax=Thalassospira sp. NFXS8 TaxID=2819093 RepID=UPI0032DF0057